MKTEENGVVDWFLSAKRRLALIMPSLSEQLSRFGT